ncbi:MAG TPA: ribonuclease Z [Cyclobacteriaceae bacterium]|nr:ribonuclease Z [Cyclobacteriaceae bacterium]
MTFILKILGANSAAPAFNRNQTSQVLQAGSQTFLIDCGEGTQLRLGKSGVKINKIDHVFISHLHGDHFFGLVGLLSTMHLFGRSKPLNIYCPAPLQEIIDIQLRYSDTRLNFPVNYLFTDMMEHDLLYENKEIEVNKFPLDHSIFCTGFLFREKPGKRKVIPEKIPKNLPVKEIARLKEGLDILNENGEVIYLNSEYTLPPRKTYSYAYCSDTRYNESIIETVREVDLLYHEATFGDDMKERAAETYHSTAREAALIAKKSNAGKLLIGHYSVRYRELDILLQEACSIFPNTGLAIEGDSYDLEKITGNEHEQPVN